MIELPPAPILNFKNAQRYSILLNHLGKPSAYFQRAISRIIYNLEESVMARKAKSTKSNSAFVPVEFVQYRLNAQEKKEFAAWKNSDKVNHDTEVIDLMQQGYKTSVSWDDHNDCWIASITCKDEASGNYNKCLTSRSDTWYDAMLMNVFKTVQLCNDGLWSDLEAETELG